MINLKKNTAAGFSLLELMVVIAIISILSAVSMIYLSATEKIYKPDVQALKIVDVLQEARQRSLTQRETMRVEFDMDSSVIRLIDENSGTTASDDVELRSVGIPNPAEITIDQRPANITVDPPEPLPAPHAFFTLSNYPPSIAHRVCTVRFQSNGMVVNAGNSPTGAGAVATGVTMFIWSPKVESPVDADISRAITIIGTTGSVRMWEYDKNLSQPNKWKDSRRTGGY